MAITLTIVGGLTCHVKRLLVEFEGYIWRVRYYNPNEAKNIEMLIKISFMARSSSGLGRLVLNQQTMGSTPIRATAYQSVHGFTTKY